MKEYPKIQSIFKRDEKTHKFMLLDLEWACEEFEYLKDNIWVMTEKIDGTNIRVGWDGRDTITYGGRTDNASIPIFLITKLQSIFANVFKINYPDLPMTLYGEGYGAKIQKGGGNYISDGVDFILFDVMIGNYWLKQGAVEDIANRLGIRVVPIICEGILEYGISMVKEGFESDFGDFQAEGLVLKPKVELRDRRGKRIITKLKYKDF